MKVAIVAALAIACVLGVATAQFFGTGLTSQGQSGLSSIFPLMLLLILFLFNGNLFNTSGSSGNTNIIFGNFSGPTGK